MFTAWSSVLRIPVEHKRISGKNVMHRCVVLDDNRAPFVNVKYYYLNLLRS